MRVPFVDLKRVAELVAEPVHSAWRGVVATTEFVGGPTVARLEEALGRRLGAKHVVACGSGSGAILIGLQALGIGPGKKVAIPNLTFWATYEAVVQLGATPVLVDVDPESLQMSMEELRQVHERLGVDGVVLVHLMGWATPRLAEIREFCSRRGIALLEDGAQSFGVEVGGHSVYQGAQISTISFFPAKVFGGCMDGGAMLTDDAILADHVRKLRNHGRSSHFSYSHVGWNSRMGGMQAAWLEEMLKWMDTILQQRREIETRYLSLMAEHPDVLRPHRALDGVVGNGYLSVCELRKHDLSQVTSHLAASGVSVGRVYPEAIDEQGPAKGALRVSDMANSRAFCRRVVNLPLFYGLTSEEIDHVCHAFGNALRAAS